MGVRGIAIGIWIRIFLFDELGGSRWVRGAMGFVVIAWQKVHTVRRGTSNDLGKFFFRFNRDTAASIWRINSYLHTFAPSLP